LGAEVKREWRAEGTLPESLVSSVEELEVAVNVIREEGVTSRKIT